MPQPFSYHTPLGAITLELAGGLCHSIHLEPGDATPCPAQHPLAQWLDAYFSHTDLPLLPLMAKARSPFQHRLRKVLLDIPAGETSTYGEIAQQLNSSPRAVGQALGANPLPILVPCHRIVARHGLGGFACGLEWKRELLAFEGVVFECSGLPMKQPTA